MGTIITDVILLKLEASYGTDPTPTPTDDALLVTNLNWGFEGLRLNDRNVVKPSLETLQQVYGGSLMTVSFDVELKGSGSAGAVPEVSQALRACAMAETINAGTSVVYTPESVEANIESCHIYYYESSTKRFILSGARGNVVFNVETGGIPTASFTFQGHWSLPTDDTVAGAVFDQTVPPPVLSTPATIGGTSLIPNAVNIDMSNELATPPDMTAADGYGEVRIASRDVGGTFDPESVAAAVYDPFKDFVDGTTKAMVVGPIGATAGNIIQFDMPAVYVRDITPGDREQIRVYEQGFGATTSTIGADDDITLTYT